LTLVLLLAPWLFSSSSRLILLKRQSGGMYPMTLPKRLIKLPQLLISVFRGNNVVGTTMDQLQTAVQAKVAPGEFFGPKKW
jgi:hypothetical protein